jgi:hypothetical protein
MFLVRACAIWILIAVAETLHGVGRTLFLTPALGDHLARQLGVFIGSLMILIIAWLFVSWIGATTPLQLLAVGLLWLVLMFGFEIGLGWVMGFSWERIVSDYDPTRGGLMLIGMGVLLFAPLLAARARCASRR